MSHSFRKIIRSIGVFFILLTFLIEYIPVNLGANTEIIVHYRREDKRYDGQNMEVTFSNGDTYRANYIGQDDFGVVAVFSIGEMEKVTVNFKKASQVVDKYSNRMIDVTKGREVWISSLSGEVNYTVPSGYTSSVVNYFDMNNSKSAIENDNIKIHYKRDDGDYSGVKISAWEEKIGSRYFEFEGIDAFGAYAIINDMSYYNLEKFAYIIESDKDDEITEARYINTEEAREIWVYQNVLDVSYFLEEIAQTSNNAKTFELDLAYDRYDNDYDGVTLEYYELGNEKELKSVPIKDNNSIFLNIIANNNIKFDIYKNGVLDDYRSSVIYLSSVKDGETLSLRLIQGTNKITNSTKPFDDMGPLIDNAKIIDDNKILVTMDRPILVDRSIDSFKIDDLPVTGTVPQETSEGFGIMKENYRIVFELTTYNLNFTRDYKISKDGVNNYVYTTLGDVYSSNNFEELYTYKGKDLGLVLDDDNYNLRLWTPTAESVDLYLYEAGRQNITKPTKSVSMTMGENGTWYTSIPINENKEFYYCYCVNFSNGREISVDPYVKYISSNNEKGILPDPEKLEQITEIKPFRRIDPSEAIIYELSIGDFTYDDSSKITDKGKYSGLVEKVNDSRETLGFEHIKELGITHVSLLPIFDFDEGNANISKKGFKSGYGTKNFNVPEELYVTDSYNYENTIAEFKNMINELHSAEIGVILDVSYSYVDNAVNSSFQKTVPNYYFRNIDGKFSQGDVYGNEFATERSMVQKFIVDSVIYWATEYGVDGFNFESMQLIDIETMEEIRRALNDIDPNIIVIGNSRVADSMLPTLDQSSKENFFGFEDNIGLLSKDFYSAVRGAEEYNVETGFINGSISKVEDMKFAIVGATSHHQVDFSQVDYSNFAWARSPIQAINYLSIYGEKSLTERLKNIEKGMSEEDKLKTQKLAAVLLFTSQGVPFFYSGEEIGKISPIEDNKNKVDFFDWDTKKENLELYNYYKGLIELRNDTAAFRYHTEDEVSENLKFYDVEDGLIAYKLKGQETDKYLEYVIIFNPTAEVKTVTVESGKFDMLVNGTYAGSTPIINNFKLNKRIDVPAHSSYVFGSTELVGDLVQGGVVDENSIVGKIIIYGILTILVSCLIFFLNIYIEKQTSFFKTK